MDRGLGRSGAVAFEHLAVEIDDQDLVGGDAGAARVARRDQHPVGAGEPRADVAAVVEKLRHHHHARALGDLRAQRAFRNLRHVSAVLPTCCGGGTAGRPSAPRKLPQLSFGPK